MTIIVIVFLLVLLLIFFTLVAGHYSFSIHPHGNDQTPDSLSMPYTDMYFKNYRGDVLHGWWIQHPAASPDKPFPTLIILHGWNRNAERMLPFLEAVSDLPMNFLLIEARGHGENKKDNFITQAGFAHDLEGALNWLVVQSGVQVEKIGVLGHSLGAAAIIYASSKDKRISFFIADSSYAHPLEIIKKQLRFYHLPYFPFGWLMVQYIQLRLGLSLNEIAPENSVKNSSCPGLLIHGDQDTVVPVEDCNRISKNAPDQVKRWIASGADHSSTPYHTDFRNVLRDFLQKQIDDSDEFESVNHGNNSTSSG